MSYIISNIEWGPNQNFLTQMVLDVENESDILKYIISKYRYVPKSFEYNKIYELYILRFIDNNTGQVNAYVVKAYSLKNALNTLYKDKFNEKKDEIVKEYSNEIIISLISKRVSSNPVTFSFEIFKKKAFMPRKYWFFFKTESGCKYFVNKTAIKAQTKKEALMEMCNRFGVNFEEMSIEEMSIEDMLRALEPKCILQVLQNDGGENNIYPATLEGHLTILEEN